MTANRYSLVRYRQPNTDKRRKGYITRYFLNFPPNSHTLAHWKFTGTKLREFCDAATDALDGEQSTIGPFHAQPHGAGIRVEWTRPTRTVHATFETTDIEALIATADELLSAKEANDSNEPKVFQQSRIRLRNSLRTNNFEHTSRVQRFDHRREGNHRMAILNTSQSSADRALSEFVAASDLVEKLSADLAAARIRQHDALGEALAEGRHV